MSDLEDIFRVQREFESLFVDFERIQQGDLEYLDDTADYLSTSLAREAFEFRDEFNWKQHSGRKFHNRDKQIGEAMDCFIFSVNQLLILGVTPQECFENYLLKNTINWERQLREGNQNAINKLSERTKSGDLEVYGLSSVSVSFNAGLLSEGSGDFIHRDQSRSAQ